MSPRVSTRLLATQSDQRLLELVASGHERAFEAVVLRYRKPLLSYCRRMGLADARAEDVLQQSLLKAWLALQRGTEVRELRPWLYRIVHNTAINAIRSMPEEEGSELDAARIETVAGVSQLELSIAAREALTDVAALPAMQREAILLSAVDGRSHEEVASALGISSGAVRGLLYRARTTLRSAAAILTPQPLLEWASGSASRVAPTAGRLAELSAGGGGEAGATLLKGAAVALTAALAAGAVLVPRHHQAAVAPAHAAHAGATSVLSGVAGAQLAASTGAPAGAAGVSQGALHPAALGGGRPGTTLSRSAPLLAGVSPPSTPTRTRGGGGAAGSQPAAAGTPQHGGAPAGGSTTGAAAASGHTVGSTTTASTTGTGTAPSEPVHTGETPPPGGAPGTGKEPGDGESDGGEHEQEAQHEKAEQEAEAARERTEREAEAAREKTENEAEIARERRERETEEASEREGGKD